MKINNVKCLRMMYFVVLLVLFSFQVFSLSFTQSPTVSNLTTSSEILYCNWNSSVDVTSTNVTWYNNTVFVSKISTTEKQAFLLSDKTKRGDEWKCSVTISNGSSALTEEVSVIIKNSAPSNVNLKNISDNSIIPLIFTLYEDSTYDFQITADDVDGDSLSYFISNKPSFMNLSIDLVSVAADVDDVGIYNFTVVANDNYAEPGLAGKTYSLNITAVNDAPIFDPELQDQSVSEAHSFSYDLIASDEELNYPLDFTIVNSSSLNLGISVTSNTTATLSTLSVPVFEDVGNHTIVIALKDSLNKSMNYSFMMTVDTINHLPVIQYYNYTPSIQGSDFSFIINATDSIDEDNLTFTLAYDCPFDNVWTLQTINSSGLNASARIDVTNLTNSHVVCKNISIMISDGRGTTPLFLSLNLTNVNDAPEIHNFSSYMSSLSQNIYNLSSFTYVNFQYYVNATDPDFYINVNEGNLSYYDNTSLFDINISTGLIEFIPNISQAGNYSIMINVSDIHGLQDVVIFNFSINPNSPPYLNNPSLNFTCYEDIVCTILFNATDTEGDNITFEISNSSMFPINQNTGLLNLTYVQDDLGNYSLRLNITDSKGAKNIYHINISILNSNDAPVINKSEPFEKFVVDRPFLRQIFAYDEDISGPNNNYIFDYLVFNTSNLTLLPINSSTGLINVTFNSSFIGNHTLNITVFDSTGASDVWSINITVYNYSIDPLITHVKPYGPPPANLSFVSISSNISNIEINISEGLTIEFDVNATIFSPGNLTYRYNYDNSQVYYGSNSNYSRYFSYTSQGNHTLTVFVEDDYYGTDNFTWNLIVAGTNQPPVLLNPVEDITINGTLSDEYFLLLDSNILGCFYDIDLDMNSDNKLTPQEASSLIFDVSFRSDNNSNMLDIEFSGSRITFKPKSIGEVIVGFSVFDGEDSYVMSVDEYILVNITNVDEQDPVVVPTVVTKTKTKTRVEPAFFQVEVEKIINLDIVAPSSEILYLNDTIIVPIHLINDGNETLKGIKLSISTNQTIDYEIEDTSVDILLPQETFDTNLIITKYNLLSTYEVVIHANVTDPKFSDKAVVLISSLESSKHTKDSANLKVTYAADLLSSKPECLDLNEALAYIKNDLIAGGNFDEAITELDNVISTCRYLVSSNQTITEPDMLNVNVRQFTSNSLLLYATLFIALFIILSLGYSIYYSNKKYDD